MADRFRAAALDPGTATERHRENSATPASSSRIPVARDSDRLAGSTLARFARIFSAYPGNTVKGSSAVPRRLDGHDAKAPFGTFSKNVQPARPFGLVLSSVEQQQLEAEFGPDVVHECLAHDVFDSADALRRQLTHENRPAISLSDYQRIQTYVPRYHFSTASETGSPKNRLDPDGLHRLKDAIVNTTATRVTEISGDKQGSRSFTVSTQFGLPEGWSAHDTLSQSTHNVLSLRTTLRSPDGGAGSTLRSFDGLRLSMEEAYKGTLPTRLDKLNTIERPLATVNFMTARSCRILGVTTENLREIRGCRIQHRPTLAHADWLQRQYPDQTLGALIDHTTWAKSQLRNTARIVGHEPLPRPAVHLQGSNEWREPKPTSKLRDWSYFKEETERYTVVHLTGRALPEVDDVTQDWRNAAQLAIEEYKTRCVADASADQAKDIADNIDRMLAKKLAAIDAEEQIVRQRYDLPVGTVPRHINFDVIYKTQPIGDMSA
ncbi:MAG: hypothetical protein H7315_05730 [Herminiimonas sp.]|nr:hypothetical protein [Herminiimonas sp.]